MYAIYSWELLLFFFLEKRGSSLNAAALWIYALDLQIFFLFISQQLLRHHVGAVYFVPQVVEFHFAYGITFKTIQLF